MPDVPRYELKMSEPIGFEVMTEVHDGRFVRHLDYLNVIEANNALEARVAELEASLLDFIDAGAGNSIDFAWHHRAFLRAKKILNS